MNHLALSGKTSNENGPAPAGIIQQAAKTHRQVRVKTEHCPSSLESSVILHQIALQATASIVFGLTRTKQLKQLPALLHNTCGHRPIFMENIPAKWFL